MVLIQETWIPVNIELLSETFYNSAPCVVTGKILIFSTR